MDTTKQIKILYYDLETVTLESPSDACAFFQIAGIIEINGEEVERFNFLVNPENSCVYDQGCLEFNGITEEDLESYPSHRDIHAKLVAIFDKHVNKFDKNDKMFTLGFNNAPFDHPKLYNWFLFLDSLKEQEIAEAYRQQQLKYQRTGLDEDKPGRMEKVFNTFGCYCWTNPLDCFPYVSLLFIKHRNLFKNFKLETVIKKLAQMGFLNERYLVDDNWHDAMFDIEATRDLFHFYLRTTNMNIFDNIS